MKRRYIAAFALLLGCAAVASHGQNQATNLPTMLRFLKQNDVVRFRNGRVEVLPSKEPSPGFVTVRTISNDHVILRGNPREDGSYIETIIAASSIQQITRIVAAGNNDGR